MTKEIHTPQGQRVQDYLSENVNHATARSDGRFLRVDDVVYMVDGLEEEFTLLFAAVGITVSEFQKLFQAGRADARLYSLLDAETYNADQRRVAAIQSKVFRISRDAKNLIEKSQFFICGHPDLWKDDSDLAREQSVALFKELFPEYDVSSRDSFWF